MAEPLQTADAAIGVAKLAIDAARFIYRVKSADKTASEISNRVEQLSEVLNNVAQVIKRRYPERYGEKVVNSGSARVLKQIHDSVQACGSILEGIRKKIGGFDQEDPERSPSLIDRVRLVFRHPAIARSQGDIEAHMSLLQTSLVLLQYHDNADAEVLRTTDFAELKDTVHRGFERLGALKSAREDQISHYQASPRACAEADEEALTDRDLAFRRLERFLKDALDEVYAERSDTGPEASSTQRSSSAQHRHRSLPQFEDLGPPSQRSSLPRNERDPERSCPRKQLSILNREIEGHYTLTREELSQGHFKQAERSLNKAIQASELREQDYSVPFDRKLEMLELMARILLERQEWIEAAKQVDALISELREKRHTWSANATELDLARLHQLSAEVYYDRHMSEVDGELEPLQRDIEIAQDDAHNAFNIRYEALYRDNHRASQEEREAYNECINLLIRILGSRGDTVGVRSHREELVDVDTGSLVRISTEESDTVLVEPVFDRIIHAIKTDDIDELDGLLSDQEVDVNKLCPEGKTPLMHAALRGNIGMLLKLRDPTKTAADINRANKEGITALHLAAAAGNHKVAKCLLDCDALDSEDKRGGTALVRAVEASQVSVLQAFELKDHSLLLAKDRNDWSILHHAVRNAKTDTTSAILDLAPELGLFVDERGMTALHTAVRDDKIHQVRALLSHRHPCEVNAVDNAKRNALCLAAGVTATTDGRKEMVRFLVKKGAEMDERCMPKYYLDYEDLREKRPMTRRDSVVRRRESEGSRGIMDGLTKTLSRGSRG